MAQLKAYSFDRFTSIKLSKHTTLC